MKVLFISNSSELYGAPKSLLYLVLDLKKRYGIIPVILVPKEGDLTNELDKNGIEWVCIKYYSCVVLSKNNKFIKKFLKKIIVFVNAHMVSYKLRQSDFDIVHSNTSVNLIGYYISKNKSLPHIYHIRETGDETFFKFIYSKNFIKKIFNDATVNIAISKFVENNLNKFLSLSNVVTVYNGVNLDINYSYKLLAEKQKVNFCVIGSLEERKNQLEVLESCNILVERGYKNFIINIVGEGSNSYKEKLTSYIKKYNLEKYIKMWGYCENIADVLKGMDIGIVSSKNEPFGRVTIEYMLSYMPVIASYSGGSKELIENYKNGVFYELGNKNSLANQMAYFLDNRDKIKEIGFYSYNYAKEHFSLERNTDSIYELYNKILNQKDVMITREI